ncbi:MAG: hypothetical protein IIC79_06070 [Chloroflexi bacterium]|nr:hypothetical protein [Chloroflexota bacterium]
MSGIKISVEYAKNIYKVLDDHQRFGYAIVSREIKNIVSEEAYEKLMEIMMKYHNANCGPFNRHLDQLINNQAVKDLKPH